VGLPQRQSRRYSIGVSSSSWRWTDAARAAAVLVAALWSRPAWNTVDCRSDRLYAVRLALTLSGRMILASFRENFGVPEMSGGPEMLFIAGF